MKNPIVCPACAAHPPEYWTAPGERPRDYRIEFQLDVPNVQMLHMDSGIMDQIMEVPEYDTPKVIKDGVTCMECFATIHLTAAQIRELEEMGHFWFSTDDFPRQEADNANQT
jgi:hypothetical protein